MHSAVAPALGHPQYQRKLLGVRVADDEEKQVPEGRRRPSDHMTVALYHPGNARPLLRPFLIIEAPAGADKSLGNCYYFFSIVAPKIW
ncbi:hypothetical protein NDU88_002105 [Pleurodeles waltl]|uniref:Uncharacterized protein n=1 Tax=Pleurodeles waltl TaxID=8319 RepID=A0AAV7WPD0_PLEWA|nr:hypothetical protein NDU88_002105 [Pleurodeles waltl]